LNEIHGNGRVARNVSISTCYGQRLNSYTKEFDDFCFKVYGVYTPKRATIYARREFGDNTIVIQNTEIETIYMKMALRDFVEQANYKTMKEE
jgi:hypothetical protein